MSFVSLEFIAFLIATVVLYFIFPKKYRFVVLLVANTAFYIISCGFNYIFLLASILSVWGAALLMDKYKKRKKLIFILTVVFNVGLLVFLKEHNSLIEAFNGLTSNNLGLLDIAVPLGISYYTLVALSYLMEMYWGRAKPFKNFIKVYLPATFFPLIVEGPIIKVCELSEDLYAGQKFDYNNLKYGYLRILWGFIKKLVIADRAALIVDAVFGGGYSGPIVIVGMVLYAVQIYAEFSGCMDIVLGIGRIFNLKIPENFKEPFASRDISEFWRRWHITLGRWLKDYIFFPLTMSKLNMKINLKTHKKLQRWFADAITSFIPLFGVWFLMGIWHGFGWKYVVYGMYYLVLILLGMLFKPLFTFIIKKLKIKTDCFSYHLFQALRTSMLVVIGLTIFRASTLSGAFELMASALKGGVSQIGETLVALVGGQPATIVLLISILLLLIVDFAKYKGVKIDEWLERQNLPFRYVIFLAALFFVLIFGMYGVGYDPASFIYQGF